MNPPSKPIRVVVTYRVCQHWRAHIFAKLNAHPDLDVSVFHGQDVAKTKLVNGRGLQGFPHVSHWTISYPGVDFVFHPFIGMSLIRHRPDVILSEGASNFFSNFFVLLYSKLFRRPVIWWTLGELPEGDVDKGFFWRTFRRLSVFQEKLASVYLGYSSVALDYFNRMGFNQNDCFVAVNCVDTNRVFESIKSRKSNVQELREKYELAGKKVILFVGAISPLKELDRLIKAFSRIRDKIPESVLMIVGDGTLRQELTELAKHVGVLDRTIFTGSVVEHVSDYFELGDVFVLPGLGGLAISEAMAHGLPVLCTYADGCEVDLVVEGKTGFRIPSTDAKQVEDFLCEKLLLLMADDELRKKISENARNLILDKHNVNTYIDGIVASIKHAYQKRLESRL